MFAACTLSFCTLIGVGGEGEDLVGAFHQNMLHDPHFVHLIDSKAFNKKRSVHSLIDECMISIFKLK